MDHMQVCDPTGCTEFGSRRVLASRRADGVTVEYQVQAGKVSPDQIKAAMSNPLFTSSFEQVMLERHNYAVVAQCVDCEQLKQEQQKETAKQEGVSGSIANAIEEATGLSVGAVVGIAVGAAAGLGAIAAAAYTFSRNKSPQAMDAAPSAQPTWSPSGGIHGTNSAFAAASMEAGSAGGGGPSVAGWRPQHEPVTAASAPALPDFDQIRFCSGCGTTLEAGAMFCGKCGTRA